MKTKFIILLLGILLVGVVIAGVSFSNLDKDVELTKQQKDALSSMNLSEYNTTDYSRGDGLVERCLLKKGSINTCEIFNVSGLSEAEITLKLDAWEKQRLEGIADVRIIRDGYEKEVIGNGTTIIRQKK